MSISEELYKDFITYIHAYHTLLGMDFNHDDWVRYADCDNIINISRFTDALKLYVDQGAASLGLILRFNSARVLISELALAKGGTDVPYP